jgi:tRNA pseudouridine38-40 synthase
VEAGALARAVAPLAGEHDFSALRSSGGAEGTRWCRVRRAEWVRWEAGLRLDIVADHFLYRMVRNLVGTALVAARTADPEAEMRAVLSSRDRARGGPTAPACGLCLEEVEYTA